MTEDPRLLALLSEDTDEPVPPEVEARIRAALAAELAAATASPVAPHAPPPPAAPAPAPAPAASAAAWKIVGVGIAGVALAGGGFVAGRATAPTAATGFDGSLARPAASAATSTATATSTLPSPSISTSATAFGGSLARPAASAATSTLPLPSASPSPPTTDFDREQSLLERARSALSRHDADAAAQALSQCAREFPKSKHAEELDYLRILVLKERGDVDAMRARASEYLAKYPNGLFKSRVEPLAK